MNCEGASPLSSPQEDRVYNVKKNLSCSEGRSLISIIFSFDSVLLMLKEKRDE